MGKTHFLSYRLNHFLRMSTILATLKEIWALGQLLKVIQFPN
jgi:hypothetical protein